MQFSGHLWYLVFLIGASHSLPIRKASEFLKSVKPSALSQNLFSPCSPHKSSIDCSNNISNCVPQPKNYTELAHVNQCYVCVHGCMCAFMD